MRKTLIVLFAVLAGAGLAQDSLNCRLVGTCDTPGYAYGVAIAGSYASVADADSGLRVIYVSDPENPEEVGYCDTQGSALGVAVAGSYAYVADGSGLRVIDVSDPQNPEEVGYCEGTSTRDIVVVETTPGQVHHVFGADGIGDLRVWRATYSPSYDLWFGNQLSSPSTPGSARGIAKEDTLVFLAMEEVGLAIFDVSTPGAPVEIGHVDTPGEARAIAVHGGYAYIADWRQGLAVVDVSDPTDPAIVGSASTDGNAEGVFYRDGEVFVADHAGGLVVFDVTDPSAPARADYYETPFANAVWVTDEYVYVADRDWGLVILEEDDG